MWRSNSGSRLSLPVDDQFFIAGSNSVLGCNCSRWKEGAIGTLSCRSKKDRDSLLREINILNSVFGDFYCGVQAQDFEGAVQDLHNSFSRIALDFHNPRQAKMDPKNENVGIVDLKKNLRRLYEMMAIGIMDNKEVAQEVKNMGEVVRYTSYQISNHNSRIDDTEMNLKEIMGKVDRIQEDLQRLVSMN